MSHQRNISLIFVAVISLILGLNSTVYAAEKYKIAINDFDAFGVEESLALSISDLIRTELFRTGFFHVMERNQMQNILDEQKFQLSGATETDIVEIGKMLSVQLMGMGSINKLGDSIIINIRLVDVEAAQVRVAETANAGGVDGVQVALKWLAQKIADSLPIQGKVIRKDNEDIIVNLGHLDKVHVGTELKIQRQGDLLRDPSTGKVLGRLAKDIATVRITQIMNDSFSVAREIEPGKNSIKIGDVVTLDAQKTEQKKADTGKESYQPKFIGTTPIKPEKERVVWPSPSITPDNERHIAGLQSNDWQKIRGTARTIVREGKYPQDVMDLMADVLQKNYLDPPRAQVDAIAWLARALGSSKNTRYRSVLAQVAETTKNRKVAKYAQRGLRELQQR